MTVKELIYKLSGFDGNAQVKFSDQVEWQENEVICVNTNDNGDVVLYDY